MKATCRGAGLGVGRIRPDDSCGKSCIQDAADTADPEAADVGTRKGNTRLPEDGSAKDPRFGACLKLLERTGMQEFWVGFSEETNPLVWYASATWDKQRTPHLEGAEAAGGMTPLIAVMRLCETVVDGGTCTHCNRVAAVESDWRNDMPLEDVVCWYRYDPETQEFRRGCA